MIINNNISNFIVFNEDSLLHALQKITNNTHGIVFVVSSGGYLEGVLTDGDFRRFLIKNKKTNLNLKAHEVCNKSFLRLPEKTPIADIKSHLNSRIKHIPLIDNQQRLVSIASNTTIDIVIGNHTLSCNQPSFIIAEIGNNHNGSVELGKRLIDEAINAGADCAKFQHRNIEGLYTHDGSAKSEDLGTEYTLDLLKKFQLSKNNLFELFDYCKRKGITPLCTPWDDASLVDLENYGVEAYKVASADLTNHSFLEKLCRTGKPLICSTGMSTEIEISQAAQVMKNAGAQFVLLHCNSTYPAPFKDINLHYLSRLKEISDNQIVGYSGHERGYAIPLAAIAMGAKVIEKHFTLDRNMEGNDHRVSLLPDEFASMVKGIREIEDSLGTTQVRQLSQGEIMNREVLGKSLVAKNRIVKGELINEKDIIIRSPGRGLPPYSINNLIGKTAKRNIEKNDFFYNSDIKKETIKPRNYTFGRPFGIPVRYHDFSHLFGNSNFDLVEFHFSYRDLELNPKDYLSEGGYACDFVVHCPELFSNDFILDLATADESYRKKSISELQKVIDATRKLIPFFHKANIPMIVVNVGGVTSDAFLTKKQRIEYYDNLRKSLNNLDTEGVEIIAQTMPPFPWHFGGQRFHNLFVLQEDIIDFCTSSSLRICLDISHSKLACNYFKISFSNFIEKVAPFTAHLHIVDAKGVDGEGLQIGDGEIDFVELCKNLEKLCPKASFIPEVWQGHKNQGEGFWIALEKLQESFEREIYEVNDESILS